MIKPSTRYIDLRNRRPLISFVAASPVLVRFCEQNMPIISKRGAGGGNAIVKLVEPELKQSMPVGLEAEKV